MEKFDPNVDPTKELEGPLSESEIRVLRMLLGGSAVRLFGANKEVLDALSPASSREGFTKEDWSVLLNNGIVQISEVPLKFRNNT